MIDQEVNEENLNLGFIKYFTETLSTISILKLIIAFFSVLLILGNNETILFLLIFNFIVVQNISIFIVNFAIKNSKQIGDNLSTEKKKTISRYFFVSIFILVLIFALLIVLLLIYQLEFASEYLYITFVIIVILSCLTLLNLVFYLQETESLMEWYGFQELKKNFVYSIKIFITAVIMFISFMLLLLLIVIDFIPTHTEKDLVILVFTGFVAFLSFVTYSYAIIKEMVSLSALNKNLLKF